MASLQWTDALGAASLTNLKPAPGDRFAGWEPFILPIGPRRHTLGTGTLQRFVFRDDYGARFELTQIPNTEVALMLRLQQHLLSGGTVVVTCADADLNEYEDCELAPGAEPEVVLTDRGLLEYAFRVALVSRAVPPVPMLCRY